jgi:branched-chain amino acid transport system substrate-binding protein
MKNLLIFVFAIVLVCMGVTATAMAAEAPIVIGIAMAQSGWMAEYDQPSNNAAQLKIEEINAAGGLLGRQLKIVQADNKTDRAQSARAAQKVLASKPKLVIVTSDYDFGAPAALVANKAGVIAFSPNGSDQRFGIQGIGPMAFSMATVTFGEGFNMAEIAYSKLGARTAYSLIDQTTQYTKDVAKGFAIRFKQLGGRMLGEDVFKNDDPSVSSQVTRIRNLSRGPDVIAISSYPPGGPSLMRQLRAAGIQSPIVGCAVFDGDYWLDAVPGLNDFYYPALMSLFGSEPHQKKQKVLEKYTAKFGKPAVSDFLTGYSTVEAWALAVERAKSFDPKKVAKELEKFRDEKLVVGSTTFTPQLHVTTQREMILIKVENGKHKVLGYLRSDAAPSMSLLFPK